MTEKINEYYWKNRDKILERQRKYFKEYYIKNYEKIKAKNRAFMHDYYRNKASKPTKRTVTIKRDITVDFI